MSEVKVNKLSPRSGTTVTIGDSGDTINIVGTLQNNGAAIPGDISSVVAGTGLSGGGTSGDVTINIEAAQPTITSLGTITTFRSTGIDDNANALAITIDSSENVGIGTSSPSAKLELAATNSGGTANALMFTDTDTGTTANQKFGAIQFNSSDSGNTGIGGAIDAISEDFDANTAIRILTGAPGSASERIRVTSAGKVGINTSSPYGKFEVHSGGGGSNYSGSSAIKSGVTWDSEASSHTISIFNYNEDDNSSGMLLVHAKGDNNKCGTLMLLFTKNGGSGVSITTVSTKTAGMSTFSAATSGNNINISTDSDCAICWQSYYGV